MPEEQGSNAEEKGARMRQKKRMDAADYTSTAMRLPSCED